MPWKEASLRGQRVLARVTATGAFDEREGRVEIRYRETDGRAYQARAANLVAAANAKVLADDACAPAEKVGAKPTKGPKTSFLKGVEYKDAWVAYTDGACTGNPGPAGSGTIVIEPGGKIRESYAYLGEATNNIAELTAIEKALERTPREESLVLHTDSQYAIGVLTKGWKAKANTELIARIRKALQGRRVLFVYVPGHSGVPMNERADELAREAMTAFKPRREKAEPPAT